MGRRGRAPARSHQRLRRLVEEDAGDRCGYCLSSSLLMGLPLVLEHIIPQAASGPTARDNLWLACYRCNEFKGRSTEGVDPATEESAPLFNPRRQAWTDHFRWTLDGTQIEGRTPTGRATVLALRLNNEVIVAARRRWVAAGWHPPA